MERCIAAKLKEDPSDSRIHARNSCGISGAWEDFEEEKVEVNPIKIDQPNDNE